MRALRVQFTVRRLMIAVAVVAMGLWVPGWVRGLGSRYTWWEIKPSLNVILFPGLALIVIRTERLRPLVWLTLLLDVFLVSLWVLAGGPHPMSSTTGLGLVIPLGG
jgi:hypothetical protein